MNLQLINQDNQLKPFYPAASLYQERIEGVNTILNIEWLHPDIEPETREQLTHYLLSHPIFTVSVCNENNQEWDIKLESFISFKEKSLKITTSLLNDDVYDKKIMDIGMWLISLCRWK